MYFRYAFYEPENIPGVGGVSYPLGYGLDPRVFLDYQSEGMFFYNFAFKFIIIFFFLTYVKRKWLVYKVRKVFLTNTEYC